MVRLSQKQSKIKPKNKTSKLPTHYSGTYLQFQIVGRLRQEDDEFKASLGNIARHHLKNKPQTLFVELFLHLKIIFFAFKYNFLAGPRWLTPVILATQEAEIRGIVVQSRPRETVHETLSGKIHHRKGLVEWLKV
jgi:hypothetical protein